MRMLKLLVVLILIGLVGLAGYAFLGDMTPDRQEVRRPLDLNAPAPGAAPPATPLAPQADPDAGTAPDAE